MSSDDEFFSASDGESHLIETIIPQSDNGNISMSTQEKEIIIIPKPGQNEPEPKSIESPLSDFPMIYQKHFTQKTWLSSAISSFAQPIDKLTNRIGRETISGLTNLIGRDNLTGLSDLIENRALIGKEKSALIGQEKRDLIGRVKNDLIVEDISPVNPSFESYLESFGLCNVRERLDRVDKSVKSNIADLLRNIKCKIQRRAAISELELIEMSLFVPALEDEFSSKGLTAQLSATVKEVCHEMKVSVPSQKLIKSSTLLLGEQNGTEDEFSRLLASFVYAFAVFVAILGERFIANYYNDIIPSVIDSNQYFSKLMAIGVSHLSFVINSSVPSLFKVPLNVLTCLNMDVEMAYSNVAEMSEYLQNLSKLISLRINYYTL